MTTFLWWSNTLIGMTNHTFTQKNIIAGSELQKFEVFRAQKKGQKDKKKFASNHKNNHDSNTKHKFSLNQIRPQPEGGG